jgi:hypothetical protein
VPVPTPLTQAWPSVRVVTSARWREPLAAPAPTATTADPPKTPRSSSGSPTAAVWKVVGGAESEEDAQHIWPYFAAATLFGGAACVVGSAIAVAALEQARGTPCGGEGLFARRGHHFYS